MCFYKEFGSELKTATKAITVYKGLIKQKGRLKSPYQFTVWSERGVRTIKNFVEEADKGIVIHYGFHSAKRWNTARKHGRVYVFIIPKGAKYYENSEEYVSNKIYLKSKISINKKVGTTIKPNPKC